MGHFWKLKADFGVWRRIRHFMGCRCCSYHEKEKKLVYGLHLAMETAKDNSSPATIQEDASFGVVAETPKSKEVPTSLVQM